MSPPAADALPGYTQTYVTDFDGTSLPAGWTTFNGQAGGDPGSTWAPNHVTVSGGLLRLNTFEDPAAHNAWVDGGACQCGPGVAGQTYGAYFVRSRTTGPGPTVVQLLWPANNSWPPEIDFNETEGVTNATTATVHYSPANTSVERSLTIDETKWNTFGVIWTPTSVTYTVNGQAWASVDVAADIPKIPMTLDLDQQTWCVAGYACPTTPVSQLVDWVAEYRVPSTSESRVRVATPVTPAAPVIDSSVIWLPLLAAVIVGAIVISAHRRKGRVPSQPAT